MKYKNELHGRLPDTVVVTSVGTLKSAIKQWASEQIEEWAAKEKDVMLDEHRIEATRQEPCHIMEMEHLRLSAVLQGWRQELL